MIKQRDLRNHRDFPRGRHAFLEDHVSLDESTDVRNTHSPCRPKFVQRVRSPGISNNLRNIAWHDDKTSNITLNPSLFKNGPLELEAPASPMHQLTDSGNTKLLTASKTKSLSSQTSKSQVFVVSVGQCQSSSTPFLKPSGLSKGQPL